MGEGNREKEGEGEGSLCVCVCASVAVAPLQTHHAVSLAAAPLETTIDFSLDMTAQMPSMPDTATATATATAMVATLEGRSPPLHSSSFSLAAVSYRDCFFFLSNFLFSLFAPYPKQHLFSLSFSLLPPIQKTTDCLTETWTDNKGRESGRKEERPERSRDRKWR